MNMLAFLKSKKFKFYTISFISMLFVIFLISILIIPKILKPALLEKASKELGRKVYFEKISFNPFRMTFKIQNFTIYEKDEKTQFIHFAKLYLNFQTYSALRNGLIIKEFILEDPYINIVRNKDKSYNFNDLINKFLNNNKKAPNETKKNKQLKYSINNIQIKNGILLFDDIPMSKKHSINDININIPFISNFNYYSKQYITPSFSAKIDTAKINIGGATKPFEKSLETNIKLELNQFDITKYLDYLPFKINFSVESAKISSSCEVFYKILDDKKPSMKLLFNFKLNDLLIKDLNNKDLINIPLFHVNSDTIDLVQRNATLKEIKIDNPCVNIWITKNKKINYLTLLENFLKKNNFSQNKKSKKSDFNFNFLLNTFSIENGKLVIEDYSLPKKFQFSPQNINLTLNNISNKNDAESSINLLISLHKDNEIKYSGKFKMKPILSNGNLAINNFDLTLFKEYYKNKILFTLKNGKLNFDGNIDIAMIDKKIDFKLTNFNSSVEKLTLSKDDEIFTDISFASIKNCSFNFNEMNLFIGEINSNNGKIKLIRDKNGKINFLNLMPENNNEKQTIDIFNYVYPIQFTLNNIKLNNFSFNFEDYVPNDPVIIRNSNINFSLSSLSTQKNNYGIFTFSGNTNIKGYTKMKGRFSLNPITIRSDINTQDINIKTIQPYLSDKVNIIFANGNIKTIGTLNINQISDKNFKAKYLGDFFIQNIEIIDKINSDEFIKCDKISFDNLEVNYNPNSLAINEIAFNNFFTNFIVDSQGRTNIQNMIINNKPDSINQNIEVIPQNVTKIKNDTLNLKKQLSENIKINKVTLKNGNVKFIDRSLNKYFSSSLSEVNGKITGLSSDKNILADINITGKVDNISPLEITGKLNPLSEETYVDIKIKFKDVEMSPVTPYSEKYIGYMVKKGKISLDLSYLVNNKKLKANNKILIDQLTLTEADSISPLLRIPVKLAIALLKDKNGLISLDVPVTGNVDDPKFKLSKVILKALGNLIIKITTAPFALIGSLFGGGDELSYIEFDYGSSILDENQIKKIDTIVKILDDRPALNLEIEGHADIQKDLETLKIINFERKLKTQKLKEIIKKSDTNIPLDSIKIENNEYDKYLKKVYKDEKFDKPKNALGLTKDLSPEEMKKLIIDNISINEDDLRLLAKERAIKIKEQILKHEIKIKPERIFIIEPKQISPEIKENVKNSRVDLKLN